MEETRFQHQFKDDKFSFKDLPHKELLLRLSNNQFIMVCLELLHKLTLLIDQFLNQIQALTKFHQI